MISNKNLKIYIKNSIKSCLQILQYQMMKIFLREKSASKIQTNENRSENANDIDTIVVKFQTRK